MPYHTGKNTANSTNTNNKEPDRQVTIKKTAEKKPKKPKDPPPIPYTPNAPGKNKKKAPAKKGKKPAKKKGKMTKGKSNLISKSGLNIKLKTRLQGHAEHHSQKHISFMIGKLKNGEKYNEAHMLAMKHT